jgi:hypothetical protein
MTMKFKAAILWLAPIATAAAQTPTPQRMDMLNPYLTGTNFLSCYPPNNPVGTNEVFALDANNTTPGSYAEQIFCTDILKAVNAYVLLTGSAAINGGSYTILPGAIVVDINPAVGGINSFMLTLPPVIDRWPLEIVSSQPISNLTLTPNGSGVTINLPPGLNGGLPANTPIRLQYVLTPNQWRVR